jgi:hypothetical protein
MVEKIIKIKDVLDEYMEDYAKRYLTKGAKDYIGNWNYLDKQAVDCGLLVCDSENNTLEPTCLGRMLYKFSR